MSKYDKTTGKPVDKTYLEKSLPIYLQKDIDALVKGMKQDPQPSYIDCLYNEVQGSINSAFWDNEISQEQAEYLRNKYLGYSCDEI